MRPVHEKALAAVEAAARAEKSEINNAQYSEILRELQRLVAGMATTADRMQARIAKAVSR